MMAVVSSMILGVILLLSVFPGPSGAGKAMPKLADRKLCADEECSHPISMAIALQDYVAPDCRFLTIHRGQVVYVFSKLKGRGRLFWGGSVQGDYYGDLAARLGYFPSSIVREDQTLKPGKIDVKTDKWDFYCQFLNRANQLHEYGNVDGCWAEIYDCQAFASNWVLEAVSKL